MRRRQLLATMSAGLIGGVAGCSSSSGTETATTTRTSTSTVTATATQTTPDPPAIEFDPIGLNSNYSDGVPNTHAETLVANPSDTDLANIQVRARWYNGDGHLLGDSFSSLPILPSGDEWYTWVYPSSTFVKEVEDVELTASVGSLWPGSTPGIEFSEVSMREVEAESEDPQNLYRVGGLAANETGEMVDIDVWALLRGDDGTIHYASSASQGGVPAGDTWAWDMGWDVLVRWALVDDYELFTQATPA